MEPEYLLLYLALSHSHSLSCVTNMSLLVDKLTLLNCCEENHHFLFSTKSFPQLFPNSGFNLYELGMGNLAAALYSK
jgi:hypothetical protein